MGTNDILKKCADFFTEHHAIVDTCMVHFITDDLFQILPQDVSEELLALSEDTLAHLPSSLFSDESYSMLSDSPTLQSIVTKIRALSLDKLLQFRNNELEADWNLHRNSDNGFQHFDKIMPVKKTHEVERMSVVVNNLCINNDTNFLVDLGSGKAYLSQVMCMAYNKNVLAIDSEEINTRGADNRQKNLRAKWNALETRASERKQGKEPSTRKQRLKAKLVVDQNGANGYDNEEMTNKENEHESQSLEKENKFEYNNIKLSTKFISDDTDLGGVIQEQYPDYTNNLGIMGLHTCGNLAPSSINIFFATSSAKFICNVGCCYHHLDEQFYQSPYGEKSNVIGFPLSDMLREQKFWLGRNARILASQPLDRLADNKNLPSHSLMWRAILQVMLINLIPNLTVLDQHVGRIAAKSKHFADYVVRAFSKLGFDLTLTEEQIWEYYNEYQPKFQHQMNCFYQLRSLFGPIVEAVILLDRLAYVEQNLSTDQCSIVKMFSGVVSPRCYAVIATKK